MTAVRIIACLDVHAGRVVKGVRFEGLRDCGDPAELAAFYEAAGADELVMLDISAGLEQRDTALETVRRMRAGIGIPLCVGGGIRGLKDVERLLEAGADKVSVNSAAWRRPELVGEIAAEFGRQCCVVAVDSARRPDDGTSQVVLDSGRTVCPDPVADWIGRAAALGAGEFLVTSRDRDGTGLGYDLGLLGEAVAAAGQIPVIASGGIAGGQAGMAQLLAGLASGASALLLAGALHRGELGIGAIKHYLADNGKVVRL